ncbi:MAG TPA: zinc-binding alcohol dehydrogenase, partial [Aestuariivirga sp.]|nr:zinc-binding alcohol dehydrogenase [Aestuariivirga sp.]
MKQVVQNFENGQTYLADVPAPAGDRNSLIIATTASLISPGTERMLVDFGRASLINKVRKQPDKVKAVLAKVRTDGLLQTVSAVKSKLAQPIPLGYCNVGKVVAAGAAAGDFKPGDRVVSNGAHAEVVRVPHTLCARIPDGVSDETAAFTVLAAIGLQGMRLLEPRLGESVAVIGAGLIGLLTIQMLLANGCRVLAIDFDEAKLHLARSYGAEICNVAGGADPVAAGLAFSRHHGVDGVIIAASTAS